MMMCGASEHLWCAPMGDTFSLNLRMHPTPLFPKLATLVCPYVMGVTFSHTLHRVTHNIFVYFEAFIM